MKKFLFLAMMVLLMACVKDTKKCTYQTVTTSAPPAERTAVQAYLTSKSLTATLHPNGFYYNIIKAGTGAKAEPCNIVAIQYSARLTNDSIFDATGPGVSITDRLGVFNHGVQLGLGLIGNGGNVQLFIPPSLGFGNVPFPNAINPVVPANSILIYDISITGIQ
ncbi:MAG: FKBP-type peptidyl-prolyl cis-trans isomerase [Chitinophagaceae bacterium]|nr:FKBP-type peptidyl-prolyl cis-trans isomerase [Chitinophagaceae bacterium]